MLPDAPLRRPKFDSIGRLRSLARGRKNAGATGSPAPTTQSRKQSTAGLLPTELLLHIIDYLAYSTHSQTSYFIARNALASCALVCRGWYFCSVEVLYRDVRLRSTSCCRMLARTLARRHDFAQRITSLYLPGSEGNMPRDPKDALSRFGNPPQRPRTSLPADYGHVLQHCRRLHDLHVSLSPTASPVPILCGLFGNHPRPGIKRLWIEFSQRAGFSHATWGAEGILTVLAHPALAALEVCTLNNVIITFGVGVPLRQPKAPLPPIRVLRLRHVSAFGDLDLPVHVLVRSLSTSLQSVEIVQSKAIRSTNTFHPVAQSLRALRITRVHHPPLDLASFTALTNLRLPLVAAHNMVPGDFPPRVTHLALDLPVIDFKEHLAGQLMMWVVQVAPAGMVNLRQVVLHGSVRLKDLCVFWAMAILCALAAEDAGLKVRTHAHIIGGALYARPSSPLQTMV